MIKKRKLLIVLLFLVSISFCLTGCREEENKQLKNYDLITCTRKAQSTEGEDVDINLSYKIYHKDGYVKTLIATDKVMSSKKSIVEKYASSYKKIYASYDGLDHFKNTITVTDTAMTSVTEIDYAHVDTDRLLEIEGKEDNVIDENGKVPLDTFLAFYEKYGVECDNKK